ncbi:hypothetical protein [Pinirhizobacter soli]|uniref:hypothetical protein n=1 Tax=Pinirhizobacter soli TaxID=2786953 RepID=UPI002029D30B|nr:hypothetical protein [Pinirhizobacter soli]
MIIRVSPYERELLLTCPETEDLTRTMVLDQQSLVGSEEQVDALRDACSEALQRIGFDVSYDLTAEGRVLEDLIDKLFIR